MPFARRAFTLIELLVVIAIIAILAVVVFLTLNPLQLLQQSRDANRLSDLSTLNDASGIYATDQSGASGSSLGVPYTIYLSIPDPVATSTAGDQCQGLGFSAPPTGWTYHCPASSTYRNTNGTGWLPINLQAISSGAPLGSLPIDPTNQSSTNLFYEYATDGTKYVFTGPFESQKDLKQYLLTTNPDPTRYAVGSNLGLVSQEEGFLGYYNFDQSMGVTTTDQSGNNATAVFSGAAIGSNGYITAGKVGAGAGDFDGTSTLATIQDNAQFEGTGDFTVGAWIDPASIQTYPSIAIIISKWFGNLSNFSFIASEGYLYGFGWGDYLDAGAGCRAAVASTANIPPIGTWTYIVGVRRGSVCEFWQNGVLLASSNASGTPPALTGIPVTIGGGYYASGSPYFDGAIDDVRIYDRALSPAEIQGIYTAEH